MAVLQGKGVSTLFLDAYGEGEHQHLSDHIKRFRLGEWGEEGGHPCTPHSTLGEALQRSLWALAIIYLVMGLLSHLGRLLVWQYSSYHCTERRKHFKSPELAVCSEYNTATNHHSFEHETEHNLLRLIHSGHCIHSPGESPRALIVAPTRELAQQVH